MRGCERSPAFLKVGHTLDNFHKLRKYFDFKQRLDNFAKNKDNSGLIFLDFVLTGGFLRVQSLDESWDFPGYNENITEHV